MQKIYDKFLAGYLNEEPTEIEGMNKTVLDLIVDVDTLENRGD